jgi:hypothetical protein
MQRRGWLDWRMFPLPGETGLPESWTGGVAAPRGLNARQVESFMFPPYLRRIPVLPLWPGFITNTLFYALLLWLLFATPFAARRMLRRRRGLCEKCAYPIGVSPVCTECGAAVRPKSND